eukprot:128030-Pyramimonas_sp.AAC.1
MAGDARQALAFIGRLVLLQLADEDKQPPILFCSTYGEYATVSAGSRGSRQGCGGSQQTSAHLGRKSSWAVSKDKHPS